MKDLYMRDDASNDKIQTNLKALINHIIENFCIFISRLIKLKK